MGRNLVCSVPLSTAGSRVDEVNKMFWLIWGWGPICGPVDNEANIVTSFPLEYCPFSYCYQGSNIC